MTLERLDHVVSPDSLDKLDNQAMQDHKDHAVIGVNRVYRVHRDSLAAADSPARREDQVRSATKHSDVTAMFTYT